MLRTINMKLAKTLWYGAVIVWVIVATWAGNYVFFLAMESARTSANVPTIEQRYHAMLAVLAISIIAAIVCFVMARRAGRAKKPSS
jgi:hypothetical protein